MFVIPAGFKGFIGLLINFPVLVNIPKRANLSPIERLLACEYHDF